MEYTGIHFGVLSDSLEKQLKDQGLKDNFCKKHQQDMDAIVTLCIHDLLTEKQAEKLRQKLVNRIAKNTEVIKIE